MQQYEFHDLANLFPKYSEGELEVLAADIKENGLLNPISLFEGKVIDGRNRYLACQRAGIEPTFEQLEDRNASEALAFVLAQNLHRRHLSESQRAMVAARLADMRQGERTDLQPCANLHKVSQGEAATQVNVSRRTVIDAAKVLTECEPEIIAAVDAGTLPVSAAVRLATAPPERQRAIAAKSATGKKVTSDIHAVKRDETRATIAATAAKSIDGKKKYSVIYADPAWRFEDRYNSGGCDGKSPENHYPSMAFEEILELNIGDKNNIITVDDVATDDAVLFLWIVDRYAREAFDVIDNWGFTYRAQIVWVKDGIGLGNIVRYKHELLYIATRGKIPLPDESVRPASVVTAPRREHSRKPDEFYEIIETMYPDLPRLELFARNQREGWTSWGNQS